MMVNCVQVWREISNYLEGDVDANLASAIEMHFRDCKHCKAVLDGTRNVIQLYGDERVIDPPLGFRRRLQRRLQGNLQPKRRSLLGWMAGAAAAVLVVGGLEIGTFSVFNYPDLRSRHAQRGRRVPRDMMVVVSINGKVFHASFACPFIHDRAHVRNIMALDAIKEGYTPCVRCLNRYL